MGTSGKGGPLPNAQTEKSICLALNSLDDADAGCFSVFSAVRVGSL